MVKVNLFIVGAMKSGTTSMSRMLSGHPDIFCSPIKEPNYFCSDFHGTKFFTGSNANYLDLNEYFSLSELQVVHGAVIDQFDRYQKLFFSGDAKRYLVDSSISYLLSDVAAENIFAHEPKAKIIIGLRNPVDRAYSEYCMRAGLSGVSGNFSDVIKFEFENSHEPVSWSPSTVIKAGLYSNQVQRYLDIFPRDNIFFYKFEDLKFNSTEVIVDTCKFLDIGPTNLTFDSGRRNASVLPNSLAVHNFLVRNGIYFAIRRLFPGRLKNFLKSIYYADPRKIAIVGSDRELLRRFYFSDVKRLETLTGLDLSDWTK